MQKNNKIVVTPLEKEIFDMILECRRVHQLKTIVRVAGGWVRDKLMNKDSNDIDLTLDDMKGEQFAHLFKQYFTSQHQKVSGFGVTRLNPDMSKHLETAKIFVKGLQIDIVNLRSESYAEDTRIPQVEIGTPKEDAQRRDLTINSLFYNIITEEVEDWTGQGLSDLQHGIIRTPLDPYVTFKDDPLRILRTFRFAGRFGFQVIPEIFEAASKPDIRSALRSKVSKERIGKEIVSMLKSKNPKLSLQYIQQNKLWQIVFEVPETSDLKNQTMIPKLSLILVERMCQYLDKVKFEQLSTINKYIVQNNQPVPENMQAKTWTAEELRFALLLTAVTYIYHPFTVPINKKKDPLVKYIIKESLKLPNKDAEFANRVCDVTKSLRKTLRLLTDKQLMESVSEQVRITTLIRWLRSAGEVWECAILLSRCLNTNAAQQDRITQVERLIEKYRLQDSYCTSCYVDGGYVRQQLGLKGAAIGTILDNGAIWRLLNQHKSKEEFIEELTKEPKKFQDVDYLRFVGKQEQQEQSSGIV